MRRILIDKAGRKSSLKRGSDQSPEELHESRIELQAPAEESLVKLRYFVGMTIPEIADALEMASVAIRSPLACFVMRLRH